MLEPCMIQKYRSTAVGTFDCLYGYHKHDGTEEIIKSENTHLIHIDDNDNFAILHVSQQLT